MHISEVHKNLCYLDRRNPLWGDTYKKLQEEYPNDYKPRNNCYCDNCFYGRDTLALEILRLRKVSKVD